MILLYRIFSSLYFFAVRIAAVFNHKAGLMINGRKNWEALLKKNIGTGGNWIWFHCASLGEFEQGRPLIEKIKQLHPEKKILLSFFSPSGYEVRKNYPYADYVCYLPFDSPKNAEKFIEILKPEALILVKYELWYYFISKASDQNVKIFLISAIFRRKHWLFRFKTSFAERLLKKFNWIFTQDSNSLNLLQKYAFSNCSIEGDTRFDRVIQITSEPYSNDIIGGFAGTGTCIVAGSTWPADEKILCDALARLHNSVKLIIVPHEIHKKHINDIVALFGTNSIVFSETENNNLADARVLIIDKMGLLSKIYRYGTFAYIGGGFGKGIHNTVEAAAYGIPVFFGPRYAKFNEAVGLLNIGAAVCIHNEEELFAGINAFVHNKNFSETCGSNAKEFVFANRGSVDRIYDKITGFLF